MIALGYLVCAALSALAYVASAAAATRIGSRRGSEFVLATLVVWFGLVLAPIHVLGLLGVLGRASLAVASIATSLAVIALSSRGRALALHLRETREQLQGSLSAAAALVAQIWRSGSLVVAAFAALLVALTWTALLTYLLPSDSWDGVWYHDLIVGYVIQQRGYADMQLPQNLTQQANGYPRNSEMMSLWLVIFADRKLIELPSVMAGLVLPLATYALCRRYARDRVSAFMWAVSLALLPGARLQMRSTYVDLWLGALLVCAYYFASDPQLDARRSVLASLALGLALGSKGQALLVVPFLAVLALVLLFRNEGRKRLLRAGAALAFGVGALVLLGSITYILNWLRYQNPFWPVALQVGPYEFAGVVSYKTVEVNASHDLVHNLFAFPQPGRDFVDTRVTGYGLLAYCLLPFALVALVRLVFCSAKLVLQGRAARARDGVGARTALLLVIVIIACFSSWKSPAIWAARYNLAAVAVAAVLVHWASRRLPRPSTLTFGAAAAFFVSNVAMWWWSDPGWGAKNIAQGLSEVSRLLQLSSVARVAVSPLFDPAMIRARERELEAGDKVVWSDDCVFPSLLWNERFSNVIEYRSNRSASELVDGAEQSGARWLVVGGAAAALAQTRADRWQRVAMSHTNHGAVPVFRRLP